MPNPCISRICSHVNMDALGLSLKSGSSAFSSSSDRKSTRLNSSHLGISYAVFCLKKKKRILVIILLLHFLSLMLGRSEERFSRNDETELVCRRLHEKQTTKLVLCVLNNTRRVTRG